MNSMIQVRNQSGLNATRCHPTSSTLSPTLALPYMLLVLGEKAIPTARASRISSVPPPAWPSTRRLANFHHYLLLAVLFDWASIHPLDVVHLWSGYVAVRIFECLPRTIQVLVLDGRVGRAPQRSFLPIERGLRHGTEIFFKKSS